MSLASRLFSPSRSNRASASSALVIVLAPRSADCVPPAARGSSGNLKAVVILESSRMLGLLTQARSASLLEALDDCSERGVGISIVQGAASILQNNPERKAFLFI